jgi:hypothetical protein
MIPQRTLIEIARSALFSQQLAQDGLTIFKSACQPKDLRNCAGHDVTVERFKNLIKYIELFADPTDTPHFQRFIDNGFSLLKSRTEWLSIEKELYLKELAYFGESDRSFRFYPITFSSSFSSLPVLP